MKKFLCLVVLLFSLGCYPPSLPPLTSGIVTEKRHVDAYDTEEIVCVDPYVTQTVHHDATWSLHVANKERYEWVNVTEKVFDNLLVGQEWRR